METKIVTFDSMPEIVSQINRKLDTLLSDKVPEKEKDYLMPMEQLIEYLPEHPARQTIYQKVCERRIPYEKHGKRLYFRKSTIDEWMANGRRIE